MGRTKDSGLTEAVEFTIDSGQEAKMGSLVVLFAASHFSVGHMTRQILVVVLAALLSGNCFGRTPSSNQSSPEEQVRAVGTHSPVEVRFIDGTRLRGWIGEVSDTGFVLSHESEHQLTDSRIAFNQISAVRQVRSVKPSHTARNLLLGVGITLAAIGIIFGIGVAVHGLG